MDENLFNPDGPALAVLAATPRTVARHLMTWTPAHPEWDVFRVRSSKCTDDSGFFDEMAAAMQSPYYFDETWIAVWDCITNLHWLSGSSFLVIFDSAQHLLSASERGFPLLLALLNRAHDKWIRESADYGADDRPIAFRSVLACDPDAVDALTERMNGANATFVRL